MMVPDTVDVTTVMGEDAGMDAMTLAEYDEWYVGDPYDRDDFDECYVECEVCGAEVAEDATNDDGLCTYCASQ